jgi:hypothetical protein
MTSLVTRSGHRYKAFPKTVHGSAQWNKQRCNQVIDWIRTQADWNSSAEEMEFLFNIVEPIQRQLQQNQPVDTKQLNAAAQKHLRFDLNDDYQLAQISCGWEIIAGGLTGDQLWGVAKQSGNYSRQPIPYVVNRKSQTVKFGQTDWGSKHHGDLRKLVQRFVRESEPILARADQLRLDPNPELLSKIASGQDKPNAKRKRKLSELDVARAQAAEMAASTPTFSSRQAGMTSIVDRMRAARGLPPLSPNGQKIRDLAALVRRMAAPTKSQIP